MENGVVKSGADERGGERELVQEALEKFSGVYGEAELSLSSQGFNGLWVANRQDGDEKFSFHDHWH